MQTTNRFLDDIAKLGLGLLGLTKGVQEEVHQYLHNHFERYALKMDLVSRQEFEVVREMAQKARMQNEELEKRIIMLEKDIKKRNK